MPRVKSKIEYRYEPETLELIRSLESMPQWAEIMLQHTDKPFCPFFKWFSERDFSWGLSGKPTLKQIVLEYGKGNSGKVKQWIREAYDEIIRLHLYNPDIFKTGDGIKQRFYVSHNRDYATVYMWLPVIPRIHEVVEIPFLKAKFGRSDFEVDRVYYKSTEEEFEVTHWLSGNVPNPYISMLYHRAIFEGHLNRLSKYEMFEFEFVDKLQSLYKYTGNRLF